MAKRNKMKKCRSYLWKFLAIALMAFGASILMFFPEFYNNQLMKNLELRNDSRTFAEWKSPSADLYLDIYMFDWKNPEQITETSYKPVFNEIGPYRFKIVRDKLKINFTEDEVSYREISTYHFVPDQSNGTLDDFVTTLDIVALGAVARARFWGFLKQKTVSGSLTWFRKKIHVTKTVREMLFEGYEDSMLTTGKIFDNDTPFENVGLMIGKNATDLLSGDFTAKTGLDDIQNLGKISKFNNLTQFPFYPEGECSKLKGSTGEFYPPNIQIKEPINLFTPEMCRSLTYEYEKDMTIEGMLGHRFSLGERSVDNGTVYDENKCYNSGEQLPSGLMNVSICNYGFPMFISYPHFYLADSSVLEAVEGLLPDKNLHQTYMTLEPKTGITLEVAVRLQTNMLLENYAPYVSLYEKVPRLFMPIFWVEQTFTIDSQKGGQLRYALRAPYIAQIVGFIFVFLGISMTICKYMKMFCCNYSETNDNVECTTVIMTDAEKPLMSKKEISIIRN